jgi:hypothetical protein
VLSMASCWRASMKLTIFICPAQRGQRMGSTS